MRLAKKCDKAPDGWACQRHAHHHGPCAAFPTRIDPPDKHPFKPYDQGYADGYNDGFSNAKNLYEELT